MSHISFCHCELNFTNSWPSLVFVFPQAGKKAKKTSHSSGGKENAKKQRAFTAQKERELNISSQHDELVITQILGSCPEPENLTEKAVPDLKTVPAHPHFGGKQPKQHKPLKCISVVCREEKDELKEQLEDLRQELDSTLMELAETKEELGE